MIQMQLLSVQIRWMVFIRILMIITQREKEKFLIVFDGMIADVKDNQKLQAIIEELFIRCRKHNM